MGVFNLNLKKPQLNEQELANEDKKAEIKKQIDSCNNRLNSIITLEETDKIDDALIISKKFVVDMANLLLMISEKERITDISQVKEALGNIPDTDLAAQITGNEFIFEAIEKDIIDDKEMRKLSDVFNDLFSNIEEKAIKTMKQDLKTPLDDYKQNLFVKLPLAIVIAACIVVAVIFFGIKTVKYLGYKKYTSNVDKQPVYSKDFSDEIFIKHWLVLGRIPSPFSETSLDTDFLVKEGGETRIIPQEGMKHTLQDGTTIEWLQLTAAKHFNNWAFQGRRIDLDKIFGDDPDAVCYAYTTIESPKHQKVTLGIGSDDSIKIWVNGIEEYRHHTSRPCRVDEDMVDITLRKGINSILLKITQNAGGWCFYFRVKD